MAHTSNRSGDGGWLRVENHAPTHLCFVQYHTLRTLLLHLLTCQVTPKQSPQRYYPEQPGELQTAPIVRVVVESGTHEQHIGRGGVAESCKSRTHAVMFRTTPHTVNIASPPAHVSGNLTSTSSAVLFRTAWGAAPDCSYCACGC